MGFMSDSNTTEARTGKQNAAMWAFCDNAAKACREVGYTFRDLCSLIQIEIPPTKETIQSALFRQVAVSMYGKSTSKLTTEEFSEVVSVVRMALAQADVHVPFSEEERALG